jgi:cyclic-di-AMP phosphodiesterase PgpH
MDEAQSTIQSFPDRLGKVWRAARLWFIFVFTIIGAILALTLPSTQQDGAVALQSNDVSPQDILAPYALTYISEVLTTEAREQAASAVPDIYAPPSSRIGRQQLDSLRSTMDYIEAVRADTFAESDQKLIDLRSLAHIRLGNDISTALLELPDPRWDILRLETTSVLEQAMQNEIREDRLEEARRAVATTVSISLTENEADLVVQLATAFVTPNALYDDESTENARQEAIEAQSGVNKSYASGETIVGRGGVVTPLHIEGLEVFGLLEAQDLWSDIAIRAMLVAVIVITLTFYAARVHPEQLQNPRFATLFSLLFIVITLGLQLSIPDRALLPYLFPAAIVPMLLAILVGPGMGVLAAFLTGALAGYLAPRGMEIALYISLAGAMGALIIGHAERLSSFFYAGLGSSLAGIAVVIIYRFPDPTTDLLGKASIIGTSAVAGFLSASLSLGLLLLLGNLLGVITNLQLIELSRSDHPLLQMILRNAPGTYQHSLQVANLAEHAARAIGANTLLTRVGALYHDAGKALRPQFFIENQAIGQNVHDQLDPTTSANVIVAHVQDGLDLAKKHRLPPIIQAFIPEHHGRLITSYQYRKAVEAIGGDETQVSKADFTYPGPKPQSRETALLMLADGVEAKARAEKPTNDEEIDQCIRSIIDYRLEHGQFDNTELTLKDIDTIRRSFARTLRGIYHPRIVYPKAIEEAQDTVPIDPSAEPGPKISV